MRKVTFLIITVLAFVALLAGACSSSPSNTTTTNSTNQAAPTNTNAASNATTKTDDETPAAVKAVFPDAQSFTTQHKDVPADKITSIEKDTGGKVPAKDHHSYLAFATKDGKRTQIGAATVLKADGKEVIIIYESKNGMPTIKEVRSDGVAKEFLAQFAGKNHDTRIKFGEDIKLVGGVSEGQAKAITQSVRIDVLTMEALYGAAHSH
jgi:hypothetical protein